jgi:hypothetical protein
MKNINNPIIITPYLFEQEIQELKSALGWKLDYEFWQDVGRIGSDLAYQYLWNKHKDRDVIILHADMLPLPEDKDNSWYDELLAIVDAHPEAGIFGMKLLYPQKNDKNQYIIQHAGGRFEKNGEAVHFGGGLNLFDGRTNKELEVDEGQYDKLREVSWVTMGGIYIRSSARATVGNFDPSYYWTYYRDVDWCLTARRAGIKIYQTSIPLLHFEGKDNKRLIAQNPSLNEKWSINRSIFMEKWNGSEEMQTLNIEVETGNELIAPEPKKFIVDKKLLEDIYEYACNTESDIYKHLPVLKDYASKCKSVTEMGARTGNSTVAFLLSDTDKFISYDYQYSNPEPHLAEAVERLKFLIDGARKNIGINANYIGANVLDIEIEETDLLFIDTWHVYEQLKEELRLHAPKVNKYIAFHDIETFGAVGEGYPDMDPNHPTRDKLSSQGGIRLAIDEFLEANNNWKIVYETKDNNGLMIIEKAGENA